MFVAGMGFFTDAYDLDKTGRRSIQILGFGLMALMFLIIGFVPSPPR